MDKRLSGEKRMMVSFTLNMLMIVMLAGLFVTYMAGYREIPYLFVGYLFLVTILFHILVALYAVSKLR